MNDRPRRSTDRTFNSAVKSTRRHKPDYWLLVLAGLLVSIGLIVVYSISPGLSASQHISQNYFITKQLVATGLGVLVFIAAALTPLKTWWKADRLLVVLAIVGAAIVMLTPVDGVYRAHRWIRISGFSFQIVEFIKLALLIWVARFLAQRWTAGQLSDSKKTLRPLLILLAIVGLVVAAIESDLGSTGVVVAMIVAMAYIAGIPMKKIALIGGIILIGLIVAISTTGYRRERLSTFLHPETNCQTTGYQACQAMISVGSGGLLGLGLGYSVQAYGYLPQAANDSIFAIIAEKFGFIGSVIVIGIYAVFIIRLKKIIERTSDQFNRLLVVGVLAWFSIQMIINVGAMLGLLPLKGITLPLISQGGTGILFSMIALGIVFQISRYTNYSVAEPTLNPNGQRQNYYSFDRRRVGRPHNTNLVARPRT